VDLSCAVAFLVLDAEAFLAWEPDWLVTAVGAGGVVLAPWMDTLWLGALKGNASYGWFQCAVGAAAIVLATVKRYGAVIR